MLVLLVRHGHAGTKRHWRGDDRQRPLNEDGVDEAQALAQLLAPYSPTRIVSSPYLRCIQTVSPLGEKLAIPVEESPCLLPEAGASAKALALKIASIGPVVLCTHGEVIHLMQTTLGKAGPANFSAEAPREKASVWVLDRSNGRFSSAEYLPPPHGGH